MEITGKNISIIGAVRSGIGAAKMIKKLGGIPFVSDSGDEKKLEKQLKILKEKKLTEKYTSTPILEHQKRGSMKIT